MRILSFHALTVKVKNGLSAEYDISHLEKKDLDVFFYLLAKFKNSKDDVKTIPIREIMNAVGVSYKYKSLEQYKVDLKDTIFQHLQRVSLRISTDNKYVSINFERCPFDI